MKASRIVAIAVAALIAMLMIGVNVANASFSASFEGYGPTLAAAEQNAKFLLQGTDGPCKNVVYYDYGQLPDGTWFADISGDCGGFN